MVTVTIISLNNLALIRHCLRSVYARPLRVPIEVIVVAHFYTRRNLETLCKEFPDVRVIESNEVRGFSENQNLALRAAHGDLCLVLNDDTYFDDAGI